MADQFYDDVPAIANEITADVDQIEKSLGYLKDCFQAVTNGWSDSETTDLAVNLLDADPTFNDVTKHYEAITFTDPATSVTVSSLDANGLYRINLKLYGTGIGVGLRFNADSGANYTWSCQHSGQIANVTVHTSTVGEGETQIRCFPSVLTGTITAEILFGTSPADSSDAIVNIKASCYSSATDYYEASAIGYYQSAVEVSTVTILAQAAADGTGVIERVA